MSYHAGEITAVDVSPVSQLVASTALDSKFAGAKSCSCL